MTDPTDTQAPQTHPTRSNPLDGTVGHSATDGSDAAHSHDLPAGSVLRYDAGMPGGEGPLAEEWTNEARTSRSSPLPGAEEALVEAQVSALVANEMVIESVEVGS